MSNPTRYTITAALPYANGPIHIGHLAGAYLAPDIYTRFLKAQGKDVVFICGSDEHGMAITLRAIKDGVTPQDIVDRYHGINKQAFEDFGIDFDVYDRTSSPEHHATAQTFFKKLYEKGAFEERVSKQYYDEKFDQFLADRYIKGTCPKCSFDEAYGDQCEKCGTTLSPSELINPVSTLSGNAPIKKSTKHWYLPMNEYEEWLKKWILEDHTDWKKNVYGQCKSWLDQGLQPRAMTRDLDWGVKVPIEGEDGKVLYVWLDAPLGYITATKKWAAAQNKDWEPYWKSDDTKLIHFIGKDNIVFHCIIFPIILKAHGDYILPDTVPANEFMNLEGDKISTSRNWAVWLHEYLADFPGKEDVLRYVLTANMPETKDSEFTWKDFQTRNNTELVGVFGNFFHRAMVLTNKNYNGMVPSFDLKEDVEILLGYSKQSVVNEIQGYIKSVESNIHQYRFRDAMANMMNIARVGNKFLADTEPWKLQKTDPELVPSILHLALQIGASLAVVAKPFLPKTSVKMMEMLHMSTELSYAPEGLDILEAGDQIEKSKLLFEKIEDDLVATQIAKLEAAKVAKAKAALKAKPFKDIVSFDDFTKLDIRIGEIKAAEKVPKADKLLKLEVDLGVETRTIVSGIAQHYQPKDIIGSKVNVLVNLAPRKIRGVESNGMILMGESLDGEQLSFLSPTKDLEPGCAVS